MFYPGGNHGEIRCEGLPADGPVNEGEILFVKMVDLVLTTTTPKERV